jgi:hypothetical protein
MKRLVVLAALLCGVIVPAAEAAPSMSINRVSSPTGAYSEAAPGHTTWHLGLTRIGAWTYASCGSTAHYSSGETQDGNDLEPKGPWNSWSFGTSRVPGVWEDSGQVDEYGNPVDVFNYLSLARITASCDLTRTVYLGKRSYWRSVDAIKGGVETSSRHANGCSIYSYADGELTIDCRHSRSWGSATWMFGMGWSDRGGSYDLSFDTHQSTMGAHPLSARRTASRLFVTEHVSPGTMITVSEVGASWKRLGFKKVYRHDKKTLRAAWPN